MNNLSKTLSIIIPCYNEEESLPLLFEKLSIFLPQFKEDYELIFVNDGSTDNTLKLIQEIFIPKFSNVEIVTYTQNKNLGGAVKEGIKKARMSYTCIIDGDCSYDPVDILKMMEHVDNYQVISASAHHPDAQFYFKLPWYRLMLSKGVVFLYDIVMFKHLNSYTSIFRVYETKLLQSLEIKYDSFVAMTEIIVKCILAKAVILDFPSDSKYRTFGVSKMKLKNTILSHFKFLFEIILHRLKLKRL